MTTHETAATAPTGTTATPPATPLVTPLVDVHVVLVPGFWLGAWAWDDVVPGLVAAGLTPHAVTLPGLEPGADPAEVTFADHVAAVTDLVDRLDGDVVLVGHSGGALVVQAVVDALPDRVARVVYVDAGPMLEGVAARDVPDGAAVPLPAWEQLAAEGASVDGLTHEVLEEFRARAVPHPAAVAAAPVHLHDDRRLHVPTTVVCTSLPSQVLRELTAAGRMPTELPAMTDVRYVDLPTGHWPMLSRPTDLARALAEEAVRR